MHEPAVLEADHPGRNLRQRAFTAFLLFILLGYTITLAVANDLSLRDAVAGGLSNALPVVLLGTVALRLIARWIAGRNLLVQLAAHTVIGTVYALLAYWLVLVLLGLINGDSPTQFTVEPFLRRAMAWQLFENYTTYAAIAAIACLPERSEPVNLIISTDRADDQSDKGLSRYFIRTGEDLRPVDVSRIISIAGADDYAEVKTTEGRHLVRLTLAEFERSLDPHKFVRVHRSRIVNLDHVERAEPAGGGRMLLHMSDGETISASRAGTRILRDLVL